jgi:hypothetical protein
MFCRNCGKELTGSPEFCMNCGAKPMAGTSFCPGCGAPTTALTEICKNCGTRITKAIKGKTWKPTAAGILSIIAGTIAVISGIEVAVVFAIGGASFGIAWVGAIGVPIIILGIVAIIGGIYALKRRIWRLALAGSICALFSPWVHPEPEILAAHFPNTIYTYFFFFWVLFGIPAIIFVSLGKGEFK